MKLARIGQHLKVRIPDSGTAPRSWWLKALQSPATMGTSGAGVGFVAAGEPYTAAAVALPWAFSHGMYSQPIQNWLRRGLPFAGRDTLINALNQTAPGASASVFTPQAANR